MLGSGHFGIPDQHWNNSFSLTQCCINFRPNIIVRIADTRRHAFVNDSEPFWTNNNNQHTASANGSSDHLPKIGTKRNGIHILENVLIAESIHEVFINPTNDFC